MKVILRQDIKGHGKKDDIVEVSDGYARNYLLPRNLAVQATADNLNSAKQVAKAKALRLAREKEDAQALAEKLRSCEAVIKARAGTTGKLFGAVTSQEISDAFKKQFDLDIDKKRIIQDEPIKQYGRYELKYKLGSEVTGTLYVVVTEE
ncbi:MAG: 50S ribosomal protein L9 [Clostridiales bacterium]|jgi:large subunit ribosomal protein L9|nr:50S ribosomal protein L9 [Clostridiales bacterium]